MGRLAGRGNGRFLIQECRRAACAFRFPTDSHDREPACPVCGGPTRVVIGPFAGHEAARPAAAATGRRLAVILDNIRSIHNVGSMFRTADGAGVSHLYLCGITPTPAHPRLAKTALGAEEAVAWSYHRNGLALACSLKEQGRQLWALEGGPRAESVLPSRAAGDERPLVLVVGNEKSGVDPAILDQCDRVLTLPMAGQKSSLNVAVAFGIAVYLLKV